MLNAYVPTTLQKSTSVMKLCVSDILLNDCSWFLLNFLLDNIEHILVLQALFNLDNDLTMVSYDSTVYIGFWDQPLSEG